MATAESCTGGLLATLMTELPGSSEVFLGGVCAYANAIKHRVLSVPQATLDQYGAVSREVCLELARGVRSLMTTDYALATTGIAGPDGGSKEKPVGTVWCCWVSAEREECFCLKLSGDRLSIRRQTAFILLEKTLEFIA